MQLAVVILAAGASSRMGQPKLLLPWGGTSVLGHLVARWREIGAVQVGVVGATGDAGLNHELSRLGFPLSQRIENPEPARGMFSSIQCAAQWPGWKETITHWAITLGDQPHLALATLRSLAEFSEANPGFICQPSHQRRACHPVLLPKKLFQDLDSSSDATLKEFLAARCEFTHLVELPDPGLDLDLDTPADYEAARQRFL
jgi:molybdenum cofactor cytidylyltransferase